MACGLQSCIWLALVNTALVVAEYNVQFIESTIERTRRFRNFSHMPVFVGRGVGLLERNELHKFINADLETAQYIFTDEGDSSNWNILRNHIDDKTLSIVLCESADDNIWPIVDSRLRKLRQTNMIVVMPRNTRPAQAVEKLFKKLWQMQFNHAVLLHEGTTYSYTPYPEVRVHIVRNGSADLFPHRNLNLRGYTIATPVENDIPRIFCITDNDGRLHVKGFGYQILSNFMSRLNGTLRISNPNAKRSIMSSVNMSHILHSIMTQELEITLHPYTGIKETQGIMGYPIFKVRNCLITPVRNEIPRYMYLFRPFEWSSWVLIFAAMVYVAFILVWTSPSLQVNAAWYERFTRSLLESIAQVLFLGSSFRIYNPKVRYFFVYLLLAVLGFFTTTWYCNLLSSFLTTFLVGHQLDSFEDLIASQSRIMAKYYETHMLLQQVPPRLVQKVEELIVPVNASVQMAHLLSFNTSFSYPFTEERWIFLALQQQYANKPIFRYSKICFGTPCVGYPMRLDSHLEHAMTQFIMDVQMAGLDHYWLAADFKDALKAGYLRLIDNKIPFNALSFDTLRMAWFLALFGWVAALVVFIAEKALHTFSK